MKCSFGWTLAVSLCLLAPALSAQTSPVPSKWPTGKGASLIKTPLPPRSKDSNQGVTATPAGQGAVAIGASPNGIAYWGGAVMQNSKNLYYIFYGNFAGSTTPAILQSFGSHLSSSPWYNINSTYTSGSGTPISSVISQRNVYYNNYSLGTNLNDQSVASIVKAVNPTDPNGIYLVVSSKDVAESTGFCTSYCAWHDQMYYNGVDVKYGFVGSPARCPSACSAQSVSPNGNAEADAMVSMIGHEVSEATTDPDLDAWFNNYGDENGDLCAWKFGTTTNATGTGGAYKYNVVLGTNKYLIQENWVNASGGYCGLHFP